MLVPIIWTLESPPTVQNGEALRTAAKAAWHCTKFPAHMEVIERHVMPGWTKEYGGLVLILYKVGTEKRLEYRWEF